MPELGSGSVGGFAVGGVGGVVVLDPEPACGAGAAWVLEVFAGRFGASAAAGRTVGFQRAPRTRLVVSSPSVHDRTSSSVSNAPSGPAEITPTICDSG
jgi:hypothetical protein